MLNFDPRDLGKSGADLLLVLAAVVAPRIEQPISVWAEGTVTIPAEANTARPGLLSWDGFEYCLEPLDKLNFDDPCKRVTVQAAGQTGKSNIGVVWFAWIVVERPRPFGLAVPTGPKASAFNSKKIQPVIDATPVLKERIVDQNSRDTRASTTKQKNYPGGSATFFSAGSVNDLQSESFGALWLTETPNFLEDVGGRGSPIIQCRVRMDGWEVVGTKELHESTPGEEGSCPVSADYTAGDQRQYFMPCPHCDAMHSWEWAGDEADKELPPHGFVVPTDREAMPWIVAPCCGCIVEERHKPAMVRAGVYVPTFPSKDLNNPAPGASIPRAEVAAWRARPTEGREPSYYFWQAHSPLKTWAGLAQDWRDAIGKPFEEGAFRQQKLGLPTDPAVKAPNHEKLIEAAALIHVRRGDIPKGTCVLFGTADIQGDRIEWAAYAHGPSLTARIDRGVIDHDPLEPEAWAELAKVVERRYEGPECRPIAFDAFGVDSGGVEGVTPRVYEFTRGRANVYAIKGATRPIVLPTDLKKHKAKDRKGRRIVVDLLWVDGYVIKRFVALALKKFVESAETGAVQPGAILFEDDVTEEDFRQLTAEVFKRPVGAKPGKRGEWVQVSGRANEQLDLAVYDWALAYQKRLHTWDADRWALEFTARKRQTDSPEPPLLELAMAQTAPQPASPPAPKTKTYC